MDIVIPLSKTTNDHISLKYALRGLERFFKPIGNVYLIGDKPRWAKNVVHVAVTEKIDEVHKERNILNKLNFAIESPIVSEDFLYFQDDHFFISELPKDYPFFYKGTLEEAILSTYSNYRFTLINTHRKLSESIETPLNFDTHCPIIINKEKFKKVFNKINFDIRYGYGIKSIYCGMNDINGQYMPDCKIKGRLNKEQVEDSVKGRHTISSTDSAIKHGLGEYLAELLSQKSQFEI